MMELRRKALGRGLGALIPGAARQTEPSDNPDELVSEVRLDSITANPFQPRQEFVAEGLEELSRSIKQNGVIQPLVVRRGSEGFELIVGERRLRAAQLAGLERVPVVVRDATDSEALELALIENLQREDLNPLDEASAYQRLMEEFQITQESVAERVARSRSAIANSLRLLALPEDIKVEIRAGRLSGGHARAIAGARSASIQVALAREAVEKRLSVRETEKRVREVNTGSDPDREAVEERLRHALGTKVRLVPKANGSGRIEIEYYSLAGLEGLIDRLSPVEHTA